MAPRRRGLDSNPVKGRQIQTADAWIAASVLHYQVPLIRNNANDYTMISGLELLTAPS